MVSSLLSHHSFLHWQECFQLCLEGFRLATSWRLSNSPLMQRWALSLSILLNLLHLEICPERRWKGLLNSVLVVFCFEKLILGSRHKQAGCRTPGTLRALTGFSYHPSFLDIRNKIAALRFLHSSSMFSLYTLIIMPANQPEIWQFSDNNVARTTSTKYFLWIPMVFVLPFMGPSEFLVLLSPCGSCLLSTNSLHLVQMSLIFILCCSVFMDSIPLNDLESHSCLLKIFCLNIPPEEGAFRKSANYTNDG